MTKFISAAALALTFASTASAMVYGGNPDLEFRIDRPNADFISGDVYVSKVRVQQCNGAITTYWINKWIDPVAGHTIQINGGDLCGAYYYWGSNISIQGNGFTLAASDNSNYTPLDPIKSMPLMNWEVTSGSMSGWGPRVYVDIN